MLRFDNITIELNYETIEMAKSKPDPILIDDENEVDAAIGLTLDQAKWLRDNIDYIIKRFED